MFHIDFLQISVFCFCIFVIFLIRNGYFSDMMEYEEWWAPNYLEIMKGPPIFQKVIKTWISIRGVKIFTPTESIKSIIIKSIMRRDLLLKVLLFLSIRGLRRKTPIIWNHKSDANKAGWLFLHKWTWQFGWWRSIRRENYFLWMLHVN